MGKLGCRGFPRGVTLFPLFLCAFSRQGATRVPLLYSSLLLAVSNYGSGSHIYFFWQKSPMELIMMAVVRPSGGIRVQFLEFLQHLSFYRHSLLCTYCTNSRSRGLKGKDLAKNKRQLSNPWRAESKECSEVDDSGYQKLSGYCRALNATDPMCDNLVWLSRAYAPGGVRSKKAIRTSLFSSDCARQRAHSTRFHTQ